MKLEKLLIETKAVKLEPWEQTLKDYISANKKDDIVYKGWATPELTVPNGVIASGGGYIAQFYGSETLAAKERIYQRDMQNRSFEAWALKLQGSKAKRFRIVLVTYFFNEDQEFDPKNVFPGQEVAWVVRAGFAFEDQKKPLAGFLDIESIDGWNPSGFFDFVRKHSGWNPPRDSKKLKEQKVGQSVLFMRKHRKSVAGALKDGKKVKPDVIKDYPRLASHKPGTPGFYAAEFLLQTIEFAKPGETVKRVVYGNIGNTITPNSTDVLNISKDPDIHGLHVTKDPDFWKKQISYDFDRPTKKAKIVHIRVMPGDIFLPDHNFTHKQERERPSSAILITARKVLKKDKDFFIEGELAGKK